MERWQVVGVQQPSVNRLPSGTAPTSWLLLGGGGQLQPLGLLDDERLGFICTHFQYLLIEKSFLKSRTKH